MRVSDADVKAILGTTIDVEPFIRAASLILDTYLGDANLNELLLVELERWLSAHLACIRDPRLREKTIGDTRWDYERAKEGVGLMATSYGQQVALMDPTGILVSILAPTTGNGTPAGIQKPVFFDVF